MIPPGARVHAALDLGSTRDLSCLTIIYSDPAEVFHLVPYFWLPGDVRERTSADRVRMTYGPSRD